MTNDSLAVEAQNFKYRRKGLFQTQGTKRTYQWKIPYSLDYYKPGEATVTEPGAFHQVLTMGANYAIAISKHFMIQTLLSFKYRAWGGTLSHDAH